MVQKETFLEVFYSCGMLVSKISAVAWPNMFSKHLNSKQKRQYMSIGPLH